MDYPKDLIVKMIDELKVVKKVSAKEIENILGYSNGMIGKIKSGRTKLPENKLSLLSKFYFDKINEGKKLGYVKQLPNGEFEFGVISEDRETYTKVQDLPKDVVTENKPLSKVQKMLSEVPPKLKGESSIDYRLRMIELSENKR